MQIPAHLGLNYAVYLLAFGPTNEYLLPFFITSVIPDIDHVFPFLKIRDKNPPGTVLSGALWRTRLHEMYGLVIFSVLLMVIWFFNHRLATICALGLILHFCLDFVTGESRPFYPYSQIKVQIFFKNNKKIRIIFEVFLGALFIALLLWQMR